MYINISFYLADMELQEKSSTRQLISEFYKCCICYKFCFIPIYGCIRGHYVCQSCNNNLENDRCPTCRIEKIEHQIGVSRMLRHIEATVACNNKRCLVLSKYDEANNHEAACPLK